MSGRSSHLDFYFISTTLCDRKKGGEEVNKKIVEATTLHQMKPNSHIYGCFMCSRESWQSTYDAELCFWGG